MYLRRDGIHQCVRGGVRKSLGSSLTISQICMVSAVYSFIPEYMYRMLRICLRLGV